MELKSFADLRAFARGLLGPIVLALIFVAALVFEHGLRGLAPFSAYGCYLIVPAGTLIMMWTSFPFADILWALRISLYGKPSSIQECTRAKNILYHGADCAMTMGIMTTTLGLILTLFSIEDVASIPKLVAFALSGLFFGLFLSGAILVPLARRFDFPIATEISGSASSSTGKRQFMGLFGMMLALLVLMTTLYSLSAALNEAPRNRDRNWDTDGIRPQISEAAQIPEFPSGSTSLSKSARERLEKLVPILHKLTNTHCDILIEGHSDNIEGPGKYRDSFEFSAARASRVVQLLVKEYGLPPERLAATGYGEFRPIVPNDTPEHRAQNRRVVFFIRQFPTGK